MYYNTLFLFFWFQKRSDTCIDGYQTTCTSRKRPSNDIDVYKNVQYRYRFGIIKRVALALV